MARLDLLALTAEDLTTLGNRGLVKRAQSEMEAGNPAYRLSEDENGSVSVHWSDEVECLLPGHLPLQEARCSCPATSLCRHLIRSVLAYQREMAATAAVPAPIHGGGEATLAVPTAVGGNESGTEQTSTVLQLSPPAASSLGTREVWSPGEIADESLDKIISRQLMVRARREWEAGHVVEVTTGFRPTAYFYSAGINLRFLVPHDARYTHCDCAEPSHCAHVALAVWAFREMPAAAPSAVISSRREALPVPGELLRQLEVALTDLSSDGVAHAPANFADRLTVLAESCEQCGLVWPGDIVLELREQVDFYRGHNARFEPQKLASLCGELLIRCDAIRNHTGAVPALFVRGSATAHPSSPAQAIAGGAARLVGLGTGARLYRGGVELEAYLQDSDSGAVLVMAKDFPLPRLDANSGLVTRPAAPPEPAPFWRLAQTNVAKGVPLGAVGGGQLLVRGGKRSPAGRFSAGRAPVALNPQSYQWDKLRQPLLVEDFGELGARLAGMPPAAMRPRRRGEDIHVVPLAGVENARFDRGKQMLLGRLMDRNGGSAVLAHPFTSRGAAGFEALLRACATQPRELRFVSARFTRRGGELVAQPLALVWGDGAARRAIQPWVDQAEPGGGTAAGGSAANAVLEEGTGLPGGPTGADELMRQFSGELVDLAGETLQLGLARSGTALQSRYAAAAAHASGLGFGSLGALLERMAGALARKREVVAWDPAEANGALAELLVATVLFSEMV